MKTESKQQILERRKEIEREHRVYVSFVANQENIL